MPPPAGSNFSRFLVKSRQLWRIFDVPFLRLLSALAPSLFIQEVLFTLHFSWKCLARVCLPQPERQRLKPQISLLSGQTLLITSLSGRAGEVAEGAHAACFQRLRHCSIITSANQSTLQQLLCSSEPPPHVLLTLPLFLLTPFNRRQSAGLNNWQDVCVCV